MGAVDGRINYHGVMTAQQINLALKLPIASVISADNSRARRKRRLWRHNVWLAVHWSRQPFSSACVRCIVALTISAMAGCRPNPDLFVEVTEEVGVDFRHVDGDPQQTYFMPRSVGSGGAVFDFDNDGRLDIYLVQNGGPDSKQFNRLYRQLEDRTFQDVTDESGLAIDGFGMGVAAGDVNNDGRLDVIATEYGRARLFLNQTQTHEPRFEDVSVSAGIDNGAWGSSVCFVDYDRDGWLDIVLANYVNYDPSRWCADSASRQEFCGPDAFPGRATRLFRNLGDVDGDGAGEAKFSDQTVSSGLAEHPGPGLGVFCADFDGDHWPDIFIANDGKPNHLWINRRDGTFSEEAITRGVGYNNMGKSEANMGIGFGDVDGNGLFDIFVTHLTEETHTLWSQNSQGNFIDQTARSRLNASKWRGTGFGTAMSDLDNDGDLDLIIVNGRVMRGKASSENQKVSDLLDPFWEPYAERNQILLNDGRGLFVDASEENASFCEVAHVSRGLICADINDDGAIDLLVTRVGEPAALYLNRKHRLGHWITVRAVDPALKRDAYGAEVFAVFGKQRLLRWVNPGYSYLCSNDVRAHFGLGKQNSIDRLEVVWPDGSAESFPGGRVDRAVVLTKGSGTPIAPPVLTPGDALADRREVVQPRAEKPVEGGSFNSGSHPASRRIQVSDGRKEPPAIADSDLDFMIAEALQRARQDVIHDPRSADKWGNLGMTFLAHELNDKASECFAEAERLDSTNAQWPYLHAKCFVQSDSNRSIELLERAVAVCQNTPEAPRLRLVEMLLETQQFARAEAHLDEFLKVFPHDPRASHAKARLRFMQGDYQGCLDELLAFDKYIKQNYDSALSKAKRLASEGRSQEAQRSLTVAKQVLSDNLRKRKTVGLLMSNALRQLGRSADAEKQRQFAEKQTDVGWNDPYDQQVSERQTGLKTMLVKADLLYGDGKLDETISLLTTTAQQYPDSLYVHILLARSLIRLGRMADDKGDGEQARRQYERAQAALTEALKIDPNSVDAQFRLGVTLTYMGELDDDAARFAEAETWYRKAVQLKNDFTMAYFNLSNVLEKQGRTAEAIEAMRSAIRSQPNHTEGLYRLGVLLMNAGEFQEAEQHLRLATKLNPSHKEAQQALERLQLNQRP
jgi:tetratricopeptide (TPR) repeat protein